LIDAEGKNLGRLGSEVASLLRGKHKPSFTPHADCGDNIVVINADKINLPVTSGMRKCTFATLATQAVNASPLQRR